MAPSRSCPSGPFGHPCGRSSTFSGQRLTSTGERCRNTVSAAATGPQQPEEEEPDRVQRHPPGSDGHAEHMEVGRIEHREDQAVRPLQPRGTMATTPTESVASGCSTFPCSRQIQRAAARRKSRTSPAAMSPSSRHSRPSRTTRQATDAFSSAASSHGARGYSALRPSASAYTRASTATRSAPLRPGCTRRIRRVGSDGTRCWRAGRARARRPRGRLSFTVALTPSSLRPGGARELLVDREPLLVVVLWPPGHPSPWRRGRR